VTRKHARLEKKIKEKTIFFDCQSLIGKQQVMETPLSVDQIELPINLATSTPLPATKKRKRRKIYELLMAEVPVNIPKGDEADVDGRYNTRSRLRKPTQLPEGALPFSGDSEEESEEEDYYEEGASRKKKRRVSLEGSIGHHLQGHQNRAISENHGSVSLDHKLTSDIHKQKMKLNQASLSSINLNDQRLISKQQRFIPNNTHNGVIPRSNPLSISHPQNTSRSVYYAVHFPTEPKQSHSMSYNPISCRNFNSLESVSSTPPPYLDSDYEAFASDASSWGSSTSSNNYYGQFYSTNPIFLQPVMYDRELIHYSEAEQFRLEPLEADYVNSESSIQYSIDIVSPSGAIGVSD